MKRAVLHSLITFPLIILLILTGGGCMRNQFELEVSLPENISYTYKITYYANDKKGGVDIEAAIDVQSGVGKMTGLTRRPSLGWIFYGNSPLPAAVFYAERGERIKMTGEERSPVGWKIEGNKINELLTGWRLENKDLLNKVLDTFYNRYDKSEEVNGKLNSAISKFVRSHPDSGASAILLGIYYDSSLNPEEESKLWKILKETGIMDKFGYLLVRQDMDFMDLPTPRTDRIGKKDIIIQSYLKNYDTLHLGNGKAPAMLLFWATGESSRIQMVDSLKKIIRLRGDSGRMIVADLCLSSDSAAWNYNCRIDSLRGGLRGIVAKGIADENIRGLGVDIVPSWLILDKTGKVVYRGENMAEAMKGAEKVLGK